MSSARPLLQHRRQTCPPLAFQQRENEGRTSKHSLQLFSNQHPQLTMVTGTPPFSHCMNEMRSPARSASVAVTMLADAPMRVALPPKQAPKFRAQARICGDSKRSRIGDGREGRRMPGSTRAVLRSGGAEACAQLALRSRPSPALARYSMMGTAMENKHGKGSSSGIVGGQR